MECERFVVACDECGNIEARSFQLNSRASGEQAREVELNRACALCDSPVFEVDLNPVQMEATSLEVRCPECRAFGAVTAELAGLSD